MGRLHLVRYYDSTTTANKTAGAIILLVILAGVVAGFVALGISLSRSNGRLSRADVEVRRLRDEVAYLRSWIANQGVGRPAPVGSSPPVAGSPAAEPTTVGVATPNPPSSAYPLSAPVPAAWHADPSGRHEYRYWDGTSWTTYVSDRGAVSID